MARTKVANIVKYPNTLPIEIAEWQSSEGKPLVSLEDICAHYDITLAELEQIQANPAFRDEVREAKQELKSNNKIVIRKAGLQLQNYLDHWVPKFMADPESPPSEKVKLFQFLSKLSRATDDPAESAKVDASKAISSVPNIIINLSSEAPIRPIEKAVN